MVMHEIVIIVAKYFIALSALVTLYVWLRLSTEAKKRFIVEGFIGGVLAVLLAIIGSKLFHDPRPFVAGHFTPYFPHGNDNGFPSDHTLLAAVFAFLTLKYSKFYGWLLIVLAVLVGLARVIAGVHHLADIAGSIVFAAIGILIAQVISRQLLKSRSIN